MAKWLNKNGDTITTEGSTYIVTTNGKQRTADVSHWGARSATSWIEADIRAGYYSGFQKVEEELSLKTGEK